MNTNMETKLQRRHAFLSKKEIRYPLKSILKTSVEREKLLLMAIGR